MDDLNTLERAFDNPRNGFESIYEQTEDDSAGPLHDGQTLSDLRPASANRAPKTEEKTLYVSETDGAPPELDELNEAVGKDWEVTDINLGRQTSTDEYCFVVTLEREVPRSFFEVVTSYPDPSLDGKAA